MGALMLSLPQGGEIRGTGVDLIECERVARVLERQGQRFLERVFTGQERDYCMGMRNPVPHLAARFAAKEAVSKCFTTGIGEHLGWRSIEVVRGERGQPMIRLDARGEALLRRLGADEVLVSLAHTANYGLAFTVIIRHSSLL